jgi:hypothetical protein
MLGAVSLNAYARYRYHVDNESGTLRVAFVETYPLYVAAVLVDRGVEMDDVIADAIVEGASVLDGLLASLDATPYQMQRQSPLELFREALRPVGKALDTSGVPRPASDATTLSFVAWDTHMLSPASSALLGTAAHEAHLRWGVSKVQAMGIHPPPDRFPTIAVLSSGADRQAITDQTTEAGYSVVDDPADASFAIIDVDTTASTNDIVEALAAGCRTIVFGSQIDDIRTMTLRAQGVWRVVSRDTVMSDLASVLPVLA